MQYELNYNNLYYPLPKYTAAISKEMAVIDKQNESGTVDQERKYKTMYDFVKKWLVRKLRWRFLKQIALKKLISMRLQFHILEFVLDMKSRYCRHHSQQTIC